MPVIVSMSSRKNSILFLIVWKVFKTEVVAFHIAVGNRVLSVCVKTKQIPLRSLPTMVNFRPDQFRMDRRLNSDGILYTGNSNTRVPSIHRKSLPCAGNLAKHLAGYSKIFSVNRPKKFCPQPEACSLGSPPPMKKWHLSAQTRT